MKHSIYYAYNGHFVEHSGPRESVEHYIWVSNEMTPRPDLQLCVHVGDRYRPVLDVKVK